MRAVAEALCDIVVTLGDGLRALGSNPRTDALLGLAMEGRAFLEVIDMETHERFKEIVREASASRIPQSMPVTLRRSHNLEQIEAQLLVVSIESETGQNHVLP